MMRHKLFLLYLLLFTTPVWALDPCTPESSPPPTTPNLGLWKPLDGQCNWGTRWNLNADTLDDLPSTGNPNTWVGKQTLNGGMQLGTGDNAIPHGMRGGTCILIKELDSTIHDNLPMEIMPYSVTLLSASCACADTGCVSGPCCVSGPIFAFKDQGGNAINISPTALSCQLSGTPATWYAFDTTDADRQLVSGEQARLYTTSAGTEKDTVIVCVRYIVD